MSEGYIYTYQKTIFRLTRWHSSRPLISPSYSMWVEINLKQLAHGIRNQIIHIVQFSCRGQEQLSALCSRVLLETNILVTSYFLIHLELNREIRLYAHKIRPKLIPDSKPWWSKSMLVFLPKWPEDYSLSVEMTKKILKNRIFVQPSPQKRSQWHLILVEKDLLINVK